MRKNKKKFAQKVHFRNACLKRVGSVLNEKLIIGYIQNNQLEFIDRQSNRITRWKYLLNNREYIIVYDKDRKQVVTIVPYKEGCENADNELYWWLSQI